MGLVIERKISLKFLGDQYKDAYIKLKAFPVKEYSEYLQKMEDAEDNTTKALDMMVDVLKSKFIELKFPNEKGELTDYGEESIGDLDGTSLIHIFQEYTGRIDPKV